jgi:hypothetical protein
VLERRSQGSWFLKATTKVPGGSFRLAKQLVQERDPSNPVSGTRGFLELKWLSELANMWFLDVAHLIYPGKPKAGTVDSIRSAELMRTCMKIVLCGADAEEGQVL